MTGHREADRDQVREGSAGRAQDERQHEHSDALVDAPADVGRGLDLQRGVVRQQRTHRAREGGHVALAVAQPRGDPARIDGDRILELFEERRRQEHARKEVRLALADEVGCVDDPRDGGRHPRAARRTHVAGAEEVLELIGPVALEGDAVADREPGFVGEAFDDGDLVGTIRAAAGVPRAPGGRRPGAALLRLRVGEEVEEGVEAAVRGDDEREDRPGGCRDLGQPLDRVEDLGVELARRHAHVGRERLVAKALVGGVGPACARHEREQDGAADADEQGEREHGPPAAPQLARGRVPDGAHGPFDRGRPRPARTPPHRSR